MVELRVAFISYEHIQDKPELAMFKHISKVNEEINKIIASIGLDFSKNPSAIISKVDNWKKTTIPHRIYKPKKATTS